MRVMNERDEKSGIPSLTEFSQVTNISTVTVQCPTRSVQPPFDRHLLAIADTFKVKR
jgi:hypothetical protein